MNRRAFSSRRQFLRRSMALAGTAALGPAWVKAAQPHYTMLFAHTFTQASEQFVVTGIELFKDKAEEYSEGALRVDIHEGGKLGGQTDLPLKVQYGAVQACQVSAQNFTPYAEVFNVLDLPFLFPDNDVFNAFLESSDFVSSELMIDPQQRGLRVLQGMWANTGTRIICVSNRAARQIIVPDDLRGLKQRVTNSKIEQQTFDLTPASPVSVDWGETYQAMQQGAVDSLHVGLGPLTANRIHEVLSTGTRLDMSLNAHVTVLSQDWYEKLPTDIQKAINQAAKESWAHQKLEQAKADERMWAEWEEMGIQVSDLNEDERAQWIAAVGHQRPEWDQWKERYGSDLYEEIIHFTDNYKSTHQDDQS